MDEYDIQEPKKQTKSIVLLVIGLIVVAALVMAIYYLTKVDKPKTFDSHPINFNVAEGLRSKQIAYQLSDDKVISSPIVFLIYSDLHHAGSKFEAGDYALNSNMTIPEIVDALTHGRVVSNDRNLTIIEGWSNSQIEKYLMDQGLLSSNSSLQDVLAQNNFTFKYLDQAKSFNYQGFLFPDTYKLAQTGNTDQLVQKMLTNFENKISVQMLSDMQKENLTLGQVLIMASIIEKEVGRNKAVLTPDDLTVMQNERTEVASVFYNRLKIGMPLESDATINYITGNTSGFVSLDDTKVKSPYNTYLNKGLPPTPISNPGLGSIEAAIYPAQTDYLYFLATSDGTTVFAKTLAEHNANKAKYLSNQ